jgi:hypothetical protein
MNFVFIYKSSIINIVITQKSKEKIIYRPFNSKKKEKNERNEKSQKKHILDNKI